MAAFNDRVFGYDCLREQVSIESNLQELDNIRKDAQSILQHLSDTHVNQSPGEGRWSVGQCFSHLIVTGRVELPYIEEAIRKGRKQQILGPEPFRYGRYRKLVRTPDGRAVQD
jgi:hypothetical protein